MRAILLILVLLALLSPRAAHAAYIPGNAGLYRTVLTGVVGDNAAFTLPANAVLLQITVTNTTANTVTGGLKLGTSSGATDIVSALVAAGNVISPPAVLLLTRFSTAQVLYLGAVVAWNSASVNVTIVWAQL